MSLCFSGCLLWGVSGGGGGGGGGPEAVEAGATGARARARELLCSNGGRAGGTFERKGRDGRRGEGRRGEGERR